jgi:hypothetical protein
MSISFCDGNGKFPILDIIASYTNNRYSLYLIFGINFTAQEFTEEEVVAKVENNDFKYITHLDLLLLCCRRGNLMAIYNLKRNGMISDTRQMRHCSLCSEVIRGESKIIIKK